MLESRGALIPLVYPFGRTGCIDISHKHICVICDGLRGCLWVGRWTGVANETWVVGRCSRLGCRLGVTVIEQYGWCLYSIIMSFICCVWGYRVRILVEWATGDESDASGRVGNHLAVAIQPCSRLDSARF